MPQPPTAHIIPFPLPAPAAGRMTRQKEGRLGEALSALDEALAAQRRAVADWRAALADLQVSVQGMGRNMQTYRGGLDVLGARVAGLRSQAAELVRRAEAMHPSGDDGSAPRRT